MHGRRTISSDPRFTPDSRDCRRGEENQAATHTKKTRRAETSNEDAPYKEKYTKPCMIMSV